jgi:mRNA-degrading endonuclease toxin of MazEF toxin-antitoxin module
MWNIRKKKINSTYRENFFYQRDIWWCSLGVNVGSEQDGKNEMFERPVIVIKKFSKNLLWIIPLTRSKGMSLYHIKVTAESYAIISQLKIISSRRLLRKMGKISRIQYWIIIARIIRLILFHSPLQSKPRAP